MKQLEEIVAKTSSVVEELENLQKLFQSREAYQLTQGETAQFAFLSGMLFILGWVYPVEVDVMPLIRATGLEELSKKFGEVNGK